MRTMTMLALAFSMIGCAATTTERLSLPPLETVQRVELDRYLGTWYEIASFPQKFQEGCNATTANYSLRDDGQIAVVNSCRQGSIDGPEDVAQGLARVVDSQSNAKLEVSFFRPFWGDYWIIDLGADYDYAVVGNPSRDYLWILSRSPQMEPALYEELVGRIRAQGYDTTRLVRTAQPADPKLSSN